MFKGTLRKILVLLITGLFLFNTICVGAGFPDQNLSPYTIFQEPSLRNSPTGSPEQLAPVMSKKEQAIFLSGAVSIATHFLTEGNDRETLAGMMRNKFRENMAALEGIDLENARIEDGIVRFLFEKAGSKFEARICVEMTLETAGADRSEWEVFEKFAMQIEVLHKNYILSIDEKNAREPKRTGGKGSSLSVLSGIDDIETKGGFSVISAALRGHLKNLNIQEIEEIEALSGKWVILEVEKKGVAGKSERTLAIEKEQNELRALIAPLSKTVREKIAGSPIPKEIEDQVRNAYQKLCGEQGEEVQVAVRSSGEAEDTLIEAFAGAYDTYINVKGIDEILSYTRLCWASLFNDKAVYNRNEARVRQLAEEIREEVSFSHREASLAVVIQELVIDPPASFIGFSIDPATGRPGIRIDATYGYGEGLVGGTVEHDSWFVSPDGTEILERRIGRKTEKMVLNEDGGLKTIKVPDEEASRACLSDDEVMRLAKKIIYLRSKYGEIDIDCEGALEVSRAEVFLQARPETKHSRQIERTLTVIDDEFAPIQRTPIFTGGINASSGVVSAPVQVLLSADDFGKVKQGVILVAPRTDHRWTPYFGGLKGVVTDVGGMNDHAAITGRQLGIPALVGTKDATTGLAGYDGQTVTLDANSAAVYLGELPTKEVTVSLNVWAKDPEPPPQEKTPGELIEAFWQGATKAGQTSVDADGQRWIGRPKYALRGLQMDLYQKAFDLVEERFDIRLRRKVEDGILWVNFEDNCEIDFALRKLSLDELERINREKELLANELMELARDFEPAKRNIKRFIDLYVEVNYYMDIGFQFNQACDRYMDRQMRFVDPGFRGIFLESATPERRTETYRMEQELARLVSYARSNHKELFNSGRPPLEIIAHLSEKDPDLIDTITQLIEDYKKFGTSHLTTERPLEKFIKTLTEHVSWSKDPDEAAEEREKSDDEYVIETMLLAYPNLHSALRIAAEAAYITEDMHHYKARTQWPFSDGLQRLGELLAELGRLKKAEDIFECSLKELTGYYDKPVLDVGRPGDVSVLTIDDNWVDGALEMTREINLGEQVRIDASIHLKDFESLAVEFAAAKIGQDAEGMDRCLKKGAEIARHLSVQLYSNIKGKWDGIEMAFTGFSGNNFRFKAVVTPRNRGSFSYTVRSKTVYQDEYLYPETKHTREGKLVVRRQAGEEIKIDLDEADSLFSGMENEKTVVDEVTAAAEKVRQWQSEKRLGYRSVMESSMPLVDDITRHCANRMEAGVQDVVLISIGGQASPNLMLQEALRPSHYNSFRSLRGNYPRIHVLDNLDEAVLRSYFHEKGLDPHHTDICIVSKSGNTLETLMNGYYFSEWLVSALGEDEALKHIVVVSNDLTAVSGRANVFFGDKDVRKYSIPTQEDDVGGRFSTFSPSGLITAAYAGIDILRLLEGAMSMKRQLYDLMEGDVTPEQIKRNKALLTALLAHSHLKNGKDILIVGTFSSPMRAAANFFRQLIGESLAKDGKGPFPIIVTGESTYGDVVKSEQDKLFLNFNCLTDGSPLPDTRPHPAININIPELDEFTLGELVYLFEEFVVWYGALLGIDPLIQPKVQLAKEITKRSLRDERRSPSGTDTIEFLDEAVYDEGQLVRADVESTLSYLSGEEGVDGTRAGQVRQGVELFLERMSQLAVQTRSQGIEHCVIIGPRELILKARSVYDALRSDISIRYSKQDIRLPAVDFIDETRMERLKEFIQCANPKKTMVQIMCNSFATEVNMNIRTMLTFMKDAPQNVIYTSNVPESEIPENIRKYFGGSTTFFPPDQASAGSLAASGTTPNELMAFSLFGMTTEEIQEFARGYARYPDAIAKKLAAYSYLFYQRGEKASCRVNMVFSYSSRFGFFNSWIKHVFRRRFAKVRRGPSVDAAIGSIDQHIILEGMLNWSNNIFTIFVNIARMTPGPEVGTARKGAFASGLVPEYALGKTPHQILSMMHKGVSEALRDNSRPNVTLRIPQLDAENLGALHAIFERAAEYEERLLQRDIDRNVPSRVMSVESALRTHAGQLGIETGPIDRELYYHYSLLRSLYEYNDQAAVNAIHAEMQKTGREFREVVCGIIEIGTERNLKKVERPLVADAVYIGGGGFGACSITRGLFQRYRGLPEDVREKMAPIAVSAITTAYDDWGNSRQIIDMFLRFWRTYVPAVGDPAAIMSWLTIPDEDWFNEDRREGYKPEGINPKMDLIYTDANRITLGGELDTLEKFMIDRIRRVHKDKRFTLPPDWLFFCANILDIARLFDREFVSQGRMDFERISGQNLLSMGGLIDAGFVGERRDLYGDPDLELAMNALGVRNAYVTPVTYAQETQGAMIVGVRNDGSEILGQYNLTTMDREARVEYIALRKVVRNRFGTIMGTSTLKPDELPVISPQAKELIENCSSEIVVGAGSTFTSITATLLTRGVVEALRKRTDLPRIFVMPPMDEPETNGHSAGSLIGAIEESLRRAFNDPAIKFEDLFDIVIMPDIPDETKDVYRGMVKSDRSVYLNEEGRVKLEAATTTEQMIDIVRDEQYQNKRTIKGLEFGSPKLDKILPANPLPVLEDDLKDIEKRGLSLHRVSSQESFFIWEGKIAYWPAKLQEAINRSRIEYRLKQCGTTRGFDEKFRMLVEIFGDEEKAFEEAEKEAYRSGKTVTEIVLGSIATGDRVEEAPEDAELESIEHLSFGGGGWHNCSLMRAMAELPQETGGKKRVKAAHLVPAVDNGGHGRVLGDEGKRNLDMYVPILGDFAGVLSWLLGEWDGENTFSDVTKKGAKMDLLYRNRFTGDLLTPQVLVKIKELGRKIHNGTYDRPDDWVQFVSNVINLSRSLDTGLIQHDKISLKNASNQNLMSFAAMMDAGVRKATTEKSGVTSASLDPEKNFAARLFDAFGIENTALQFQTYDQACLVAMLEGCVLKIGDDAVLLRREGDLIQGVFVKKDAGGNLVTTPLLPGELIGGGAAKLIRFSLNGNDVTAMAGIEKSSIEVTIKDEEIVLTEGKEGQTLLRTVDASDEAHTDGSWTPVTVGGVPCEVMGRRIEGQFSIAMEEHIARIEKVALKEMRPERSPGGAIIFDTNTGWIDYEVSDDNSDVSPAAWARDFIRNTGSTIRFDPGGALTTQVAALLSEEIVRELSKRKDIPRVYLPPLTRDVIISGLSLREVILAMERSMEEALGSDDISFEDIFSHVFLPAVPSEIQERYLELVKNEAEKYVNEKGRLALKGSSEIEDVRSVLSDTGSLNEAALADLNKDPAKTKAKRKKMLPAELLPVTDEDRRFIEERGIAAVTIEGPEHFGIWENKIVYEPRTLRDTIIKLGDSFVEETAVRESPSGDTAGETSALPGSVLFEESEHGEVESAMHRIHRQNVELIPPIKHGKVLWHVIPTDLIPFSARSQFINMVNKLNRDYPDSREKIKLVTGRQDLGAVVRDLVSAPENIVGVAAPNREDLDALPEGVRAFVFEGELGDFRQLEGILALLRALHQDNVSAIMQLYQVLTGAKFNGNEDDIKNNLANPSRLARIIIFNLRPIEIDDGEELQRLNTNLLKLIRSA
ncbi:MAG: PEP/pyruvate-binding domain-containing protein [Candidatus Omnitrophota bacterium]